MSKNASEGDFAEPVLAVYVEELVAEKHVLYVGDPASAAPARLAKSAKRVDVVSPRARARGTRRGGRVNARPWPTEDDEGRWDVVIVPDLPAAGLADEDEVDRLASWLAEGGVLVAGTPDPEGMAANPTALGYEAFFELLEGAFDSVRMIGQAPFSGWSVVDFAPATGELEVTFDGSLLEGAGEAAARYFALCGDDDVVLDAYAVIQIPSAAVAAPEARAPEARGGAEVAELSERLREQQDALDAANVHSEEIERELEEARESLARARGDLKDARARADAADRRRAALSEEAAELEEALRACEEERDASGTGGSDEEYARLETALRERGRELTALRQELERRGTLARDLIEELEEARAGESAGAPPPPGGDPQGGGGPKLPPSTLELQPDEVHRALQAQVADAVERAVAAEAEKAELAFRLDEVRGELAVAQRGSDQNLEEMRRLEAALRGTVRGLNARLAEVTELYQLTQARLALAEDDRRAVESKNRGLVKELAETREQLELEIARARTRSDAAARRTEAEEGGADLERLRALEQSAAEREGQLVGALMQCREEGAEIALRQRQAHMEAELAQEALAELEERVEGMRLGYETRLAELVAELDGVGADAERALIQVGELKTKLEVRERVEAALRGELAGVRMRLADREEAVRALRGGGAAPVAGEAEEPAPAGPVEEDRVVVAGRRAAEGEAGEAEPADAAGEDLGAELARVREEAEGLRARVAELSRAAPGGEDGGRVGELRAAVGSRDAMIARLQTELSHATERRRELERRVADCAAELEAQREEVAAAKAVTSVQTEEGQRELEEMTERLERSEGERKRALDALEEARGILTRLSDELPAPGEEDEEPYAGPTGSAEARRLRERLSRLDAEAADREVLLRSLTAQLQERDDRIRALERLQNGEGESGEDPGALKARLLEMEERVARLTEELEHERDARQRLEDRA